MADWGDDGEDEYLSTIDWDAEEKLIHARRQSSGAQLATNSTHRDRPPQPPYAVPSVPQQTPQWGIAQPQQQPQWQPPLGGTIVAPSSVRSLFCGGALPPPAPAAQQQQQQQPYGQPVEEQPQYYQQQQQQWPLQQNGQQHMQYPPQPAPPQGQPMQNTALPSGAIAQPLPMPQQQQPAAAPAPAPPPPAVTLYASLELPRSGAGAAAAAKPAGKPLTGDQPLLEVRMGWHDAAAAALRRVGGGTWDARKRSWLFPLSSHDMVVDALRSATGVRVKVDPLHPLPAAVLKAAASIPDDSSRYCHVPTTLETQLMEFQREGVKFALKHGGRCLIGDEMGLGKTVQALALAAAYKDEWPGLIVAPSSLREQWADALHKWLGLTEDRVYIVHSGKDAAAVPSTGIDFLIVSYNFLDKMNLAGKYQLIIVDESHYIKDGSAKRTKAAMPVLKEARRCLLLTGTPALNRPKEVFTQLSALVPSAKIKMKDFGERYCGGSRFDRYGGAQNLDELHSMLRGSVMVRRLKCDVLSQLPKKRRQQVFLSLDAEARRELSGLGKQLEAVKAVVAQLAAVNAASSGAVSMTGGGGRMDENRAIMEMYRRTAELKSKAVGEYIEMLLDGGTKFLVFAHHTALMDAVEHTCNRRKGCRFIRIDGKTPPSDRQRLVNLFQDDDSVRVAILSIRAAGVGLTLTAASTVVFAEMTWTPGEIIQAEDRAHRIGQASAVNVYFLHVRNSVDDIIWQSVQNKLENVGQALDGEDRGMEVTGARTMPEKGQMAINGFVTQKTQLQPPTVPPLQQLCAPAQETPQPQQQPTRTLDNNRPVQQASMRKFFPSVAGAGADACAANRGSGRPGQENNSAGAGAFNVTGTKRSLGDR